MSDDLSTRQRMLGDAQVASCLQAHRDLQRFLDGEVDTTLAARIARHLQDCRACGLEADVYREIKDSVHRHAPPPSASSLERLNAFAATLPHQRA